MEWLQVSGISKKQKDQLVVNNVSCSVAQFSKMAVAGETGSGKSSLFKIISGLMQPDAGAVYFKNNRVVGPEEKLLPGHPHIAYLSQHFELRNNYRVEEELDYTNHLTDEEAFRIYEVCDIAHLLKRWTNEISGGEKQRIALARTLIASPELLLLDEPFSNLDMTHKSILKKVIDNISDSLKITCMLITHDPLDSLSWADEIIVLKNGCIVQKASAKNIYDNPVDTYTASLFGNYQILSAGLISHITGFNYQENIFVRPEYFFVNETRSNAIPTIVESVRFYGAYTELEVAFEGEVFSVRTSQNDVSKGDTVFVSVRSSLIDQLHSIGR